MWQSEKKILYENCKLFGELQWVKNRTEHKKKVKIAYKP